MAHARPPTPVRRPNRWPGLVFGLLGVTGFAFGFSLAVQRLVIVHSWRETPARVIESRVETAGSQYRARIRVVLERPGLTVESEPAHDYRGGNHGWIAALVDRHPVGSEVMVRRDPRDPARTRLAAGWNFATFGFPGLLMIAGLVFGGVGALADRSARLDAAGDHARTRAEARQLLRAQYLGVAAFVGTIAAATVIAGLVLAGPAWRQRQWPVVTSRVERSDIFVRSSVRMQKPAGSPSFHVGRLFVRYDLGGRLYESVALLPGSSTNREEIERRLAAIPPGTGWPIRVNPADPHETAAVDAWPLVLPGVFLSVGLVIGAVTILLVRSAPRRGK